MAKKKIRYVDDTQLSLINQLENIKYTDEQKEFVEFDGKESVILAATAGSGKTFSCVQRLKELTKRKIDPERMIFFSFTKAATEELKKRVGRDDIKITTIHSFAFSILAKIGKFKKIATFYDFINWYKTKNAPPKHASYSEKESFYEIISAMYEDAENASAQISSYKLQTADGVISKFPLYFVDYEKFLRKTKSRDFSDMLIEVRDLLKEDKWLKMFRGKYDYIFVDEYQDTSVIQLEILLSLNAKHYYLIGDRNQSIYGYSGANCNRIEGMLKSRRDVIEQSLSINFRSDVNIVDNSNRFSSLKATPKSKNTGFVKKYIIFEIKSKKKSDGNQNLDLIDVLDKHSEVAILVRTNSVIKSIEFELLKQRYPMRYFNFITETDFKEWKKGNVSTVLKGKFNQLKDYFKSEQEIFMFIEMNKHVPKLVTSIHKSKGREFENCVVVNSIDPDLIKKVGLDKAMSKKQLAKITFDPDDDNDLEPKNIHYVAVSRSKKGLYYMLYNF